MAPLPTPAPARLMTAAQFWHYCQRPKNQGRRLELLAGEIHEDGGALNMAPAGGEHGETTLSLTGHVWQFNRQHNLGRLTSAEAGYILCTDESGRDTVRASEPLPRQFVPFQSDLAVEVISPHDSADQVEAKVFDYLRYAVRLVWLVYRALRLVVVHTPSGVRRLTIADTLDGGDILPGFSLPVAEIFPK